MKKIIWTYGLISGGIFALMMVTTAIFQSSINFDSAEIFGFTTMIAAFVMVYFGIRSYRDQVLKGAIGFGRAFQVGLLITLISCACYVISWVVVYYQFMPDFGDRYVAHLLEKAVAAGKSQAEVAQLTTDLSAFAERYKNPLINAAYTFAEVFPIGLLAVLISAGLLSRRKKSQ